MATSIMVPIAGPYSATWDAFTLGVQNDDGYELAVTIVGQEVNETDQFGMTLVEAIFRGFNWRCRLRNLTWALGTVGLLKQFGTSGTAGDGLLTPTLAGIGSKWSATNQTLLLTSLLGSPPTAPATLTATNSGFAPNSQSAFQLTSKVREVPVEMVLLPYPSAGSGSTPIPFSTT